MSRDARDFNNIETRAVIKYFFFQQGKAPKKIRAILTEILGEHTPMYATVKNWVAQFTRGDFSTCDAHRPGQPKTVTTPEIHKKNTIKDFSTVLLTILIDPKILPAYLAGTRNH